MATSHLQVPPTSLCSVPLDLLKCNSDIPFSELVSFWNKERPQSDALPRQCPEPQALQNTLIFNRACAPEFPNPSVIRPHVCPQRSSVAMKAALAVNQPGFVRESPIKIFERMKTSRDTVQKSPLKNMALRDGCNWDILLSPYSKTRTLDSSQGIDHFQKNNNRVLMAANKAGDPSNAPLVEGPDACPGPRTRCQNPAVYKPSPLKVFVQMKAAALRRQKPISKEDAENAVPGGENHVSSPHTAHVTRARKASNIPGAEDEAGLSSCFASPDPVPEEKEKGNEADDEMSQNSQMGMLAGDTVIPEVCRPPSMFFKNVMFKTDEKLFKESYLCPILNSPTFRGPRTQMSKVKEMEKVVSEPETNAKKPKQVIALHEWVVKQLPDGGVCVEGKRVELPDAYWHSGIIVERLGSNKVKTLSGQIYKLKGGADLDTMKRAGFPPDLIQKFQTGFPVDWKTLDAFFKKANGNKIPKTGRQARPKHKKGSTPSQQSAKTLNPSDYEAPDHTTKWKRGTAHLLKESALLPRSCDTSSQDSQQPQGIDDATYTAPQDDKSRWHQQSSTAWKTPEGTLSSHPTACRWAVSRSGRTIKPVLKYWCGERFVVNKNLEVTFEKGSKDHLCMDLMLKRTPRSRHQPKAHYVSTMPARENSDFIEIESENERTVTADKSSTDSDLEKCKTNLPQVMVTPLTKYQLKAKCKRHNLRYESAELSYQPSVAPLASVSQCPGPNHQALEETIHLRGKGRPFSSSSSSEETISSSPSSEELANDTKAVTKRSCGKSKKQTGVEKRPYPKTGQPKWKPSARGTSDNLSGLASAAKDRAPCEKKAGHASVNNGHSVAESGNSRQKSSRNMMSSVDPSDSDTFYGGRYARGLLCTNRDQQPGPSGSYRDKWTEKELKRLVKTVTMLERKEKWSWEDVAKRLQTRTTKACQKKYKEWLKANKPKEHSKKKTNAKQNQKDVLDLKDLKITAKVGTLKRKKQMMALVDHLQKDDCDDLFSSTPCREKRIKVPSMNMSSDAECDFNLEEHEPTTSTSSIFPLDATPDSNHLTPRMLKPVDRSSADRYMYRFQKATKRNCLLRCDMVNKRQAGQPPTTPVSQRTSSRNVSDHVNTHLSKLFQPREPDTSEEEEEDYYFGSSP